MNDLKFTFRQLLKNPGFTTVAVLTLALGIGANTAIFSLINAALFRPINAREPRQLVSIFSREHENAANFRFFSYLNFAEMRANKEVFDDVLAFAPWTVGVEEGDLTHQVQALFVSVNYFSLLGVAPARGRTFLLPEETDGTPVAILSHAYWKQRGADPGIVGQTVKLNARDFTVVGIMPEGFTGTMALTSPGFFLPLGVTELLSSTGPEHILTDRAKHRFSLVGRLKSGLTLANIDGPLALLNDRLVNADLNLNHGQVLVCASPSRLSHSNKPDKATRKVRPLAALALGLASIVLLIACLNLANMMLARGTARRKEIAVRLALGATGRRVLRLLLIEGFVLSLLGGIAGLLLAIWAADTLVAVLGTSMRQAQMVFETTPDVRILTATLSFCVLATLAFTLGPALKLSRLDVNRDLKEHAGEDIGARRGGVFAPRNILVVAQIALSLALLVTSGLFARSAANAVHADPGFSFGSNFFVELQPWMAGYAEPRKGELFHAAVERVSALPGVESASLGLSMPFGDSQYGLGVQRAGAPVPGKNPRATAPEEREFPATYNVIGTDYFRTLGVPLLRGREFTRAEVENPNSPRVALVNQAFAEQLWPGEEPLGQQFQFTRSKADEPAVQIEVVGVVPAVKKYLFGDKMPAMFYVPYAHDRRPSMNLHVRVAPGVDPGPLMIRTREELRQLDPRLPVTALSTLRSSHENGMAVRMVRIGVMLFGTLGVLATLLAVVGVYGVKAYAVARRTREIGIRMALGATTTQVLQLILREGAILCATGVGLGLLLAMLGGRLAQGFLYEVSVLDPVVFTVAPTLLALAALLACCIPARRAARVDPMEALRHE